MPANKLNKRPNWPMREVSKIVKANTKEKAIAYFRPLSKNLSTAARNITKGGGLETLSYLLNLCFTRLEAAIQRVIQSRHAIP